MAQGTLARTSVAMLAFAANSVLCRLALGAEAIDAGSFTAIRLGSGAASLLLIVTWRGVKGAGWRRGNWISAAMLFLYAVAFSFAYLDLTAGTGALILFGAVQLTMLLTAIRAGERPPATEWVGLALASGGLVYLVSPGLTAPPLFGAASMTIAGVAWGIYSLRGRGSADALGDTAGNFLRASPFGLAAIAVTFDGTYVTPRGVILAVLSGALTSGLGYVIWYAALRGLTAVRAALVQLSVPVIAALAGVGVLGERITVRIVVASVLVLGGIGLAITARRQVSRRGG